MAKRKNNEKDTLEISKEDYNRILAHAYQSGKANGFTDGYNRGKRQGYEFGYQDAKEEWYEKGRNDGWHELQQQINHLEQTVRAEVGKHYTDFVAVIAQIGHAFNTLSGERLSNDLKNLSMILGACSVAYHNALTEMAKHYNRQHIEEGKNEIKQLAATFQDVINLALDGRDYTPYIKNLPHELQVVFAKYDLGVDKGGKKPDPVVQWLIRRCYELKPKGSRKPEWHELAQSIVKELLPHENLDTDEAFVLQKLKQYPDQYIQGKYLKTTITNYEKRQRKKLKGFKPVRTLTKANDKKQDQLS